MDRNQNSHVVHLYVFSTHRHTTHSAPSGIAVLKGAVTVDYTPTVSFWPVRQWRAILEEESAREVEKAVVYLMYLYPTVTDSTITH